MADPTGPGDGASDRIRRLTRAALNAAATVVRVEGAAEMIGVSLANFDRVLGRFDEQLGDFAVAMDRPGASIDVTLRRIERIVDTADWLLTSATAVRGRLSRWPYRDVADPARTVASGPRRTSRAGSSGRRRPVRKGVFRTGARSSVSGRADQVVGHVRMRGIRSHQVGLEGCGAAQCGTEQQQ